MSNLLKNPGFEVGKFHPVPGWDSMSVPEDWQPFFKNDPGKKKIPWDSNNESGILAPEFKPVNTQPPYLDPPRVHSGTWAMCWFAFWKVMDAGLYQQVKVTPGQALRLTAWAHAWSNSGNEDISGKKHASQAKWSDGTDVGLADFFMLADPAWPAKGNSPLSDAGRNMIFQVGIDPTGGTDAWADSVVWGPAAHIYNVYHQTPPAEAVAQGDTVTVFLRTRNLWGFMHNDVYWDDVELVEIAGLSAPTPLPGAPVTAPAQPRGAPRVQFNRTFVLLSQSSGADWLTAIAALVTQRGWTVGFNPDDAGMGDLNVRRVIAVNPATIGIGVTGDWFNQNYPGVQFTPVEAATLAELVTKLQSIL